MIRIIRARPILTSSIVVSLITAMVFPNLIPTNPWITLVVSWNAGSFLYLSLTFIMMVQADPDEVKSRALNQDTGNYIILMLVIFSAIVCIVADIMVLGISKSLTGNDRLIHIVLAAITIISSWAFTQTMFAVHYAHDFYTAHLNKQNPGLMFPGHDQPDYLDFLYFSCMIGTSGQTSDVSISSRSMRRVSLLHCVMAFFFNATLIALTINIAAGFI